MSYLPVIGEVRNRISLVFLAALAAIILFAPAAHASTITVDSLSDGGGDDSACALRDAITAANTDTASINAAGNVDATPLLVKIKIPRP